VSGGWIDGYNGVFVVVMVRTRKEMYAKKMEEVT
jgi:hypothetical protein